MMFSISNQKPFKIYLVIRFVLTLCLVILTLVLFYTWYFDINLDPYLSISIRVVFVLLVVDLLVSPSFFQIAISEYKISVVYSQKNFRHILFWFKRQKPTILLEVPLEQFNGYQISFKSFRSKKYLILYKREADHILKSDPIPISLINIQSYTNIIIQLDKITHEMRDYIEEDIY